MAEKFARLNVLLKRRMPSVEDEMILRLFDKFGALPFRRCSAPSDFSERVIKDTFSNPEIKTALEIGTLAGITAAIMTQYVDKVYTFDIEDNPLKYKVWDFLGVNDKIDFYLVKNELHKRDIINKLDFDIAYSDGDHLHHTFSDFLLVEKCGRVLIHEARQPHSQPFALAHALPKNQIKYFTYGKYRADIAYWSNK